MKKVYDEVIAEKTEEILAKTYPSFLPKEEVPHSQRMLMHMLAGIQARQEVIIDELVAMQ